MQSASDRNEYATWHPPADLVSDFKAPSNAIESRTLQYLPPNTQIPKISKSSPSNKITFMIPQGGAIDTKSLRLHLKMKLSATLAENGNAGWIRLDNAGWSSMIHSINIYENGQIIEQINDAAVLAAMLINNTPEDYVEGVLAITESTQYYEDDDTKWGGNLRALGLPGGKTLMAFRNATNTLDGTPTALVSAEGAYSCSLNLPIGIFNTNRPFFNYLYQQFQIDIVFKGWSEFLQVSPLTGANTNKPTAMFNNLHVVSVGEKISFTLTDAQLRYDLLSLSNEFKQSQLASIRTMEGGFFEYPYNSYKVMEHQLNANLTQIIKVSGTSGTTLESIMFSFLQFPSNDLSSPSQSFFSSMHLKSYYFMVGGYRRPMQDIFVQEGSLTGTAIVPWAVSADAATNITQDESDGYLEHVKSNGMYKSYAVGLKGASIDLVNSKVAPDALVTLDYEGKRRRVFSYSFQSSYDQEVVSGLVLADNSEISLVLNFAEAPQSGTRMYTALNYSQKLLSNGVSTYNQM